MMKLYYWQTHNNLLNYYTKCIIIKHQQYITGHVNQQPNEKNSTKIYMAQFQSYYFCQFCQQLKQNNKEECLMSSNHYYYKLPNHLRQSFNKSFGQRSRPHLHKTKKLNRQQQSIIFQRQAKDLNSEIWVNQQIAQFQKNLILVEKKGFSTLSRQQSKLLSGTKGYIQVAKAKRQKSLQSGRASRMTQNSKLLGQQQGKQKQVYGSQ